MENMLKHYGFKKNQYPEGVFYELVIGSPGEDNCFILQTPEDFEFYKVCDGCHVYEVTLQEFINEIERVQ